MPDVNGKKPLLPMLVRIDTDGTITAEFLDSVPNHVKLHDVIDGWIELIPYFDTYEGNPCLAFCDEEGKLKQKPVNREATRLWYRSAGRFLGDILVGTVAVVVGPKEFLSRM